MEKLKELILWIESSAGTIDLADAYDKAKELESQHPNPSKSESEIITSSKEFAKSHNILFDYMTESMLLNAIRETQHPKPTQAAEEILKKHLDKKGLTNNHIHVAAYTSCIDAMKEYANQSTPTPTVTDDSDRCTHPDSKRIELHGANDQCGKCWMFIDKK